MTSFSSMRISLAINAKASCIESVLNVFWKKWTFINRFISKLACFHTYFRYIMVLKNKCLFVLRAKYRAVGSQADYCFFLSIKL